MGKQGTNTFLWNYHRFSFRPVWVRISIPLAFALFVTWATLHPFILISYRTPFLLYFGIIFISAAIGGSLSSLVASLSSAAFCLIFILPKHPGDTYFFVGATAIFLGESLLLTSVFKAVELTEEKLLRSEERFHGVIERSSEGFLITSVNGIIQYVSPSVKDLLGYTKTALLETRLQDLIHPDEQQAFESMIISMNKRKELAMAFLQRVKNCDGNWSWIEGTGGNQPDDKGTRSLVFHYRNVTDRINKEQQREDFVHMASHELKTPVTALKGFIQLQLQSFRAAGRYDDIIISGRMEVQTDLYIPIQKCTIFQLKSVPLR